MVSTPVVVKKKQTIVFNSKLPCRTTTLGFSPSATQLALDCF